jgi:hypothetical protein
LSGILAGDSVRLPLLALVLAIQALGAPQRFLDGLWATDGYGLVFEFSRDTLTTFEVTRVSCLPSDTFTAVPAPANAVGAYALPGTPLVLTLVRDRDDARASLGFSASDVVLRRIPRKPAACDTPTPNTPISNFDVFTTTFAEHYPFFKEKQVDWTAVVAANRAKVSATTSAEELFTILAGMILPLRDAHTGLAAPALPRSARPVRRTDSFVPTAERASAYALVEPYLAAPLRAFCQGQLEFAMIGTSIGYLRIRSFSSYSKAGTFEADSAELGTALDTIFAGAAAWKGLVIDVRLNTGGADPLGLLIAGRLTATNYTAYVKQARNDPADPARWTAPQTSLVQTTSRPGFRGPVIELIGVQSVSAAETFTQALLGRQPKVIRLGENTQGVFSDVLDRKLPNGWHFGLPNERFVTDGKSYDLVGIAPDIAVESLTPAARATGKDAAIEMAIKSVGG